MNRANERAPLRRSLDYLLLACAVWLAGAPATGRSAESPPGSGTNNAAPARMWARKMSKPGLKNLHQVSPTLYRGAQPTAQGMRELEAMGVRTIVNLRAFSSDRGEAKGTKLVREEMSFKTWHPEDKDVIRFLKIVANTNRLPVFVHCQHGSDRTGTMVAIYRVAIEGWSKEEAIAEMTRGDFGFHKMWQNLVRYLRGLDIAAMKRRAGLVDEPRTAGK